MWSKIIFCETLNFMVFKKKNMWLMWLNMLGDDVHVFCIWHVHFMALHVCATVWQQVHTFNIKCYLPSSESCGSGDHDLAYVIPWVRCFGVFNVQGQVGVRHFMDKTNSTCKLGSAITIPSTDVWDDLKKDKEEDGRDHNYENEEWIVDNIYIKCI